MTNSGKKKKKDEQNKLYLNKVTLMQNNIKQMLEKSFRHRTFTTRNVVIMHY